MRIDGSGEVPRLPAAGLALLFALALLPRVTGMVTYINPDENWSASVRVLTGELRGGTSQTLPLVNYLNAASFIPLYAIGRLIGVWHDVADFRAQYFHDKTPFVFAGRLVAAGLGALTPILAALIAGRLGLGRRASLLVGAMVALYPMDVWLSHWAKTDSGAGLGVLLLAWAILVKLDRPASTGADVLVGVAAAVPVSFKQTTVLVVLPLLLGMPALLRSEGRLPWGRVARGLAVALAAAVAAAIPMNLGVLLDIRGFLEWQRLLLIAVESARSGSWYEGASMAIRSLLQSVTGLTPAGLLAWLLAPSVRRDGRAMMLWVATAVAYVAINVASGPFVDIRYYFPYNELAFTVGCVAAVTALERGGASRPIGILATAAILICGAIGTSEVVRQTMSRPLSVRCGEVIRAIADPSRDRILAADTYLAGVPISEAAAREDRDRESRLASRYGIKLPERPIERLRGTGRPDAGYFVRAIPYGLGGDPDRQGSLSSRIGKIMPYWWPIQREEWDLDYWTSLGFTIFLLQDGAGLSGGGHPLYDEPLYGSFHEEIERRCELVATIRPTRPILGEGGTVRIYRLREASPRPGVDVRTWRDEASGP